MWMVCPLSQSAPSDARERATTHDRRDGERVPRRSIAIQNNGSSHRVTLTSCLQTLKKPSNRSVFSLRMINSLSDIVGADRAGTRASRWDEARVPAAPVHRHPPRPCWCGVDHTRCTCARGTIRRRIWLRSRWVPWVGRTRIVDPRCVHRHGVTTDTRDNGCVVAFRTIDMRCILCSGYIENRPGFGRACHDVSMGDPYRVPRDLSLRTEQRLMRYQQTAHA